MVLTGPAKQAKHTLVYIIGFDWTSRAGCWGMLIAERTEGVWGDVGGPKT